jgi:hypothetical protein
MCSKPKIRLTFCVTLILVLMTSRGASALPAMKLFSADATNTGPSTQCTAESDGRLISFLGEQRTARSNPECIEQAIETLGAHRVIDAAAILTDFLDFPEPLSLDQESARMLVASSHFRNRYKATDALFHIGEPAVPSLIRIIQDPISSPIKLKNALQAYVDIRREAPNAAVRNLRSIIGAERCQSLMKAEDNDLIVFLQKQKTVRSREDWACLSFALLQLGMAKSTAATSVVLDYLDFKCCSICEGTVTNTDPDYPLNYEKQCYPAVTALYLIGPPSVPKLLRLLANANTPSATHTKGVETIMLLYAEYPPQGISVIRSFAGQQNIASQTSLANASASAVQFCDIAHRSLCETALRKSVNSSEKNSH